MRALAAGRTASSRSGLPKLAAVAIAAAVLWPEAVAAQTAPPSGTLATAGSFGGTAAPQNGGGDLLAPSLEGSTNAPQRFRRPAQTPPSEQFTAQNRIGTTPTYGSPSGFGAGDTGFDSMNMPRSRKKKRTNTAPAQGAFAPPVATFTPVPAFGPPASGTSPPPTPLPPPEIYPRRAAQRPGAALPASPDEVPLSNPPPEVHPLPAANRPGAILAVPPPEYFNYTAPVYAASTAPPTLPPPNTLPLGAVPQRPLPFAMNDPYAALGIRAGSFLLFPSLDLSAASTSNAERVPGSASSLYFVAAPELRVQSDWSRHSLSADIAGSYTQYTQDLVPSLNVPYLNSKVDFRYDVSRDTAFNAEARYLINTDNPGSPNLQAQLARLPLNFDVGDTLGVTQQFGRLAVSLRGTFDRATYDASQLTDGTTSSNADRNFNQYAGIGRVGYEIDPGFKPFVEVEADQRIHDEEFDRNGLQRDSNGTSVKAGSELDLFGSLTGEMAAGYVERVYRDATLPNVSGAIGAGALIWQPTALTTAKFSATSQVYETVVDGASAEFSRDLSLEVDHAFRGWLVGIFKTGWGNDLYPGQPLLDNRYFVSVGLTYKFTRELWLNGTIRQDWQIATESGFNYNATSFLLGLRLQR